MSRLTKEEYELTRAFPITSVCKVDIMSTGKFTREEVLKLDDADMERLANGMAEAYLNVGFWIDLPLIIDDIMKDIRKEEKNDKE